MAVVTRGIARQIFRGMIRTDDGRIGFVRKSEFTVPADAESPIKQMCEVTILDGSGTHRIDAARLTPIGVP